MAEVLVAVVLALIVGVLQSANAEVPAIFILGDSTVDVGTNNHLPDSNITANDPHNGVDFPFGRATGRFSNGFNTADFIAKLFGFKRSPLSFLAFNGTDGIKKPKFRGINFASAGSGLFDATGQPPTQKVNVVSMGQQVYQFSMVYNYLLENKGQSETEEFLSKSLFFISTGSNDIMGNYHSDNPIPKEQFIPNLALVYEKHLRNLMSFGARRFGIIGVPPVGCCPSQRLSAKGECAKDLNDQAEAFFSAMDTVMRNLCSNRRQYLFWDLFHPTQAASKMVAFKLYSGGPEYVTPINFSQLAEAY